MKSHSAFIFLTLGIVLFFSLLTQIAIGQTKSTIGIQPSYVSPFQQNNTSRTQPIRPDTVIPYSINKRENSLLIKFTKDSKVTSFNFFDVLAKDLGMTEKEKFNLVKSEQDELRITHYRYQQTYKDIKVEGGELLLHEQNRFLSTVNGYFFDSLNINTNPAITPQAAIQLAMKDVGAEKWMWESPDQERFLKETTEDSNATYVPKTELLIAPVNGFFKRENFRLCYKINIAAEEPYEMYDVYVDAHTGEVINKISQIHDATGPAHTLYSGTKTITTELHNGVYRLRDNDRKIETYDSKNRINYLNKEDFTDSDNNWTRLCCMALK